LNYNLPSIFEVERIVDPDFVAVRASDKVCNTPKNRYIQSLYIYIYISEDTQKTI